MKWLRVAALVALVAAMADWFAFRRGWLPPSPERFAALVAVMALGLVAEFVRAAAAWARAETSRGRAIGRLLACGGLLAAIAGGTVNWLLSLQGYVVLVEGEAVLLGAGGQLEGLEMGPLGDPRELAVELTLADVELVDRGGGSFDPVSAVVTRRAAGDRLRQMIGGGQVGSVGPLRLRQGAFGYAPRLVVLRGERTLFDRVVPFTTRRDGAEGTRFAADVELATEGLHLAGEVALDSLDERLQGHPTLRLAVRGGDSSLGTGELLPGRFAELADGYRVGFAGLKKWSEIDVARRNYVGPMLGGFAVAAGGALLWAVAAWRRW